MGEWERCDRPSTGHAVVVVHECVLTNAENDPSSPEKSQSDEENAVRVGSERPYGVHAPESAPHPSNGPDEGA
jgi:hypothetical protein